MGILAAAQGRGELPADADLEAAADMLVGGMHAHYLAGLPIDEEWIDRLVAAVLRALGA